MWQRSPTRNKLWVAVCAALLVGQVLYNYLVLQVSLNSSQIPYEFLASLPMHIWLISFIWPILVIGINLLVKRAEIKATIRQQRRARFDFNTKLGMNSPFWNLYPIRVLRAIHKYSSDYTNYNDILKYINIIMHVTRLCSSLSCTSSHFGSHQQWHSYWVTLHLITRTTLTLLSSTLGLLLQTYYWG